MTDKHRCSGLSKGLWWLLALIGLASLYYLMLSAKWDSIEKDIQTRTAEKLNTSDFDRVTVEIKKRGRDVLLNGITSSESAREQAIEIAKAVKGVRIVEDKIKVIPLVFPDFLLTTNADNKVTLSGTMPSQDSIDTLLNATVAIYGIDNVENKLSIGKKIESPSWLSNIKPFIYNLKSIKNANLELSAEKQMLSGIVQTEDRKSTVLSKFTSLFGDKAIDGITVIPLKKPSLQVNHKDGKVIIEGILGSQEKVNELISNVIAKVGKDNVINKLTFSEDYSSTNGSINLMGETVSKDSYDLITSTVQKSGNVLGLNFNNKLTLNKEKAKRIAQEKAAAEKAEAERIAQEKEAAEKAEVERIAQEKAAAEKAEAERIAQEKAAAEKAEAERIAQEKAAAEAAFAKKLAEQKAAAEKEVKACQARLNQIMADKTILFRTNKANIKRASFPLLNNIVAAIKGCRGKAANTTIAVSGHTDSRGSDAYNLQLSQRRANAVRTYLSGKGVDQAKITSQGYGETQPVASNATSKGRSQNRRITFSVR